MYIDQKEEVCKSVMERKGNEQKVQKENWIKIAIWKVVFVTVQLYQVQVTSMCGLKLASFIMVKIMRNLNSSMYNVQRATSIVELFGSSSSESSSPLES